MRVGFGSYAFRWAIQEAHWTPEDLLVEAASMGAEVVQICDNMPPQTLSAPVLEQVARLAEQLGLKVEIGIRGATLQEWRRGLDAAQRAGARLLRLVLSGSHTVDEWASALGELVPDLRRAGVVLAIENHFDRSPAELARLIRLVDDPMVGACLDPLNSIARLVGPSETIEALAPLAVSVHVKDATVTRAGTGFGISGCRLGTGLVDVPALLAALHAAARPPNLLVESWMDPLEDLDATLAREIEWARDGLAWLRGQLSGITQEQREVS